MGLSGEQKNPRQETGNPDLTYGHCRTPPVHHGVSREPTGICCRVAGTESGVPMEEVGRRGTRDLQRVSDQQWDVADHGMGGGAVDFNVMCSIQVNNKSNNNIQITISKIKKC